MFYDAFGTKVIVTEPKETPKYEPVNWEALGDGKRRCKNCDKLKKNKGYSDFICKHMKGYREASARVRRCTRCNEWKKREGIPGDFWCKHKKYLKSEWDGKNGQGWFNAEFRAMDIRDYHKLMQDVK